MSWNDAFGRDDRDQDELPMMEQPSDEEDNIINQAPRTLRFNDNQTRSTGLKLAQDHQSCSCTDDPARQMGSFYVKMERQKLTLQLEHSNSGISEFDIDAQDSPKNLCHAVCSNTLTKLAKCVRSWLFHKHYQNCKASYQAATIFAKPDNNKTQQQFRTLLGWTNHSDGEMKEKESCRKIVRKDVLEETKLSLVLKILHGKSRFAKKLKEVMSLNILEDMIISPEQ